MADGEVIDVSTVSDAMFAEQVMCKTIAFKYEQDKVVLCSPANGTLGLIFPTGHAFGVITNNDLELLVHIGIDTVNSKGNGFKVLNKKQGDLVKAGDPIVEVDIKKLTESYNMSTMLIVTKNKGKDFRFIEPQKVVRGQSIIKQ